MALENSRKSLICKGCSGYQSISLTTTAETKSLTAGNDTVDGSTLNSISTDTITDSSTTDSDIINILIDGAVSPTIVANVETVNVTGKYGAATVDATKWSGVKSLVGDSAIASGALVVNSASATSVAAVKASTNISTLTVTTAASGTGTGVDVNAGTAATVTLTGTAAKTDVINLTVNGGSTSVTQTVLADSADVLNITGATSANTVTLAGTATTGATKIDLKGAQNITLKADADVVAGKTVVDSTDSKTTTLQVTAATSASGDLSKVGTDYIQLDAVNTGATFANNANVKLNTTSAAALTAATGATTLNVDLMKATTGALTAGATAFTAIKVTANTVDVTSLDLQAGTSADVTLSGSKAVTLATTNTSKKVDATALTGILTSADIGTAGQAELYAGAGNDLLSFGTWAAATTVLAGAGDDTITIASTATTTGNYKLTIDGEGGTGDTLVVAATTDLSNGDGNGTKGEATDLDQTSVITGIEKIDIDTGVTLTITQKQLYTNGNTFTLTDVGTLAIVDDNVSAEVFDISGVKFTPGIASVTSIDATGATAASITGSDSGDSLKGGAGVDTINGGAGSDSITGAGGADVINVGTGAADTVVLAALTDTYNSTTLFADKGSVVAFDLITGMGNGDKIDFAAIGTLADAVAVKSTYVAAATDDIAFIRGNYDASAKTFTAGAASTDNDYMLQIAETTGATNAGVILVDIVGTVSLAYASEIATLTVA